MPTGAVRTELRLDPHRSRDTAGSERTEFTATSDRVRTAPSGETRTTESRHRIRATGRGVRSNRVERSLRGASGHGDLQGRSGNRTSRRGDRTECRPSGRSTETGQWCRAERSGATPTGLREDGSDWHQLLMARETVTTRVRSRLAGNVSRKAASPAAPQRPVSTGRGERNGRCELIETQVNSRRSISGGSVRLECPERSADFGLAAPDGAFFVFRTIPRRIRNL